MRASLALAAAALVALTACQEEQQPPPPPPPAPEIVSFTATPNEVKAGEKTKLAWETKNATRIELLQVGVGLVSGVSGNSGSVEVAVNEQALFVLKAKNDRGVEASSAAAVALFEAPSDVLFVASPAEVDSGDAVTLAWSAAGAREVSLAVKGGAAIDTGTQTDVGTVVVNPVGSTTYVLTVDGKTWEQAVVVAPAVSALAATPAVAMPGQPITIDWQTAGAKSVSLVLAGVGPVATETDVAKVADGSFTFNVPAAIDPAGVLNFSLAARSLDDTVTTTRELAVYVGGAPKVREWNVPTYGAEGGSFTVSWKTTGAEAIEVLRDGVVVHTSANAGQAASGSLQLPTGAADTRIQLVARDGRGSQDVSEERTVSPVGLPALVGFTASTNTVAQGGDPVTLSWEVTNARELTITAVGEYTVTRITGAAAAAPGSITVHPNSASAHYVLTANNGLGNAITPVTQTVTVTTPATPTFSPALTPVGAPIELTGTGITGGGNVTPWNFALKNVPGDAFIDISGTGTRLPTESGQDTEAYLAYLPEAFNTTLFGVPVSARRVNVGLDGWFSFRDTEDTGSSSAPGTFPNSLLNPLSIMPYFDDLDATATTQIYWQLDGQGAQQRLIVQWNEAIEDDNPEKVLTFQAQVYASGDVVFAYQTVDGFVPADIQHIGIINADMTGGTLVSNRQFADGMRPAAGDTLHFFGSFPLPLAVTAEAKPFVVRQAIGQSHVTISGQPAIYPAGQFRISEVMYNPATGKEEWFEVENLTATAIDLNGWTIDFGNSQSHTIAQSLVLPANGRLLFGQTTDSAEASAGGAPVDYAYGAGFTMDDTSGQVSLTIGSGVYVAFSWTSAGSQGVSRQQGAPETNLRAMTGTALFCSARTTFGSAVQKGTPGAVNTGCFPYAASSIPGAFTSIMTTGTAISNMQNGPTNADTATSTITLAAPISYAGQSFTELHVSANGLLGLKPLAGAWDSNDTSPDLDDPNAVIAPFWDDLDENSTAGTGGVFWQQFDPDTTPGTGDEFTIVSWENWKRFGDTSSLNFQVKFLANGDVEFHYGTMTASTAANADGSKATTWIEHPDLPAALTINVDSATPGIQANSGHRFTYIP